MQDGVRAFAGGARASGGEKGALVRDTTGTVARLRGRNSTLVRVRRESHGKIVSRREAAF